MTDEKIIKILINNYKRFLKIRNELGDKKEKYSFREYQRVFANIVECCDSTVSAIFAAQEKIQEEKK